MANTVWIYVAHIHEKVIFGLVVYNLALVYKCQSFYKVVVHMIITDQCNQTCALDKIQGPVVQSVVSLTSSLRVISLTVLVDSIHNILIFFAEKM